MDESQMFKRMVPPMHLRSAGYMATPVLMSRCQVRRSTYSDCALVAGEVGVVRDTGPLHGLALPCLAVRGRGRELSVCGPVYWCVSILTLSGIGTSRSSREAME